MVDRLLREKEQSPQLRALNDRSGRGCDGRPPSHGSPVVGEAASGEITAIR